MVPDTVVGVLLSIVLLAPGFMYLETRERHHPGVNYSPIRETSLVVTTSLSTLTVSVAVFAIVHVTLPNATPNVGAFIRQGTPQFRAHYLSSLLWGLGIVGFACLLAGLSAIPPRWCATWAGRMPLVGSRCSAWLTQRRGTGPIRPQSGWGLAVTLLPDTEQWIDVVLLDGTCLYGMLRAHSTQIEETADRDLVLSTPIRVRTAGAPDWTTLAAGSLVVSAARISYFTVQYVTMPTTKLDGSASPPAAADGDESL